MTRNIPKTFLSALKIFHNDPKKTKSFFKDKRLSHPEKQLLNASFDFRDNNFEKAIKVLNNITIQTDPIVESYRLMLFGVTKNNQGDYKEALSLLKKSYELLPSSFENTFVLRILHNLFVVSLNLSNQKLISHYFDLIKNYIHQTMQDKILYLRAKFNFESFYERLNDASESIKELSNLLSKMGESDRLWHLVDVFMFYIKLEDFNKSELTLKEMKNYRKYNLTENFNFMRLLLNHHTKKTPLYFSDLLFKKQPILLYQLKVIQSFEEQDEVLAKTNWIKLQKLNPDIYLEDFKYVGEKNIFSVNLLSYLERRISKKDVVVDKENTSLTTFVYSILKNLKSPIRKDELYKAIYQKEAKDKEDLRKLTKLLYYAKKQFNFKLSYKKGCYSLIT